MRTRSAVLWLTLVTVSCTGGNDPTTSTTPASTTVTSATVPAETTTTLAGPEAADIVFTNGVIHTQDPEFGTVEALAITDDRIVAVGSTAEIDGYTGSETRVVDLEGRTAIPGFVDAHTHILTDTGSVAAGQPQALENGITTVAEGFVDQGRLDILAGSAEVGELKLRTNLYLIRTDNCGNDQGLWYEAYPPGEMLADRVRVAGVKIFADGGTCGPLAASQPYKEGVAVGEPFTTQDVVEGYIRDADQAGYQVLAHAIGDLAIGQVMDAYLNVLGPGGAARLNHRIDHNTFLPPELVGRYDELGVSVALFGWLYTCDIGPGFTEFWYDYVDDPARPIAANPNTVFGWHGDDPWIGPVSPLWEMFSLETRAEPRDGTICQPDERIAKKAITRDKAFEMMTNGSAYLLNQSDLVGSLTPGKYADVVVLSDDLMAVEAEQLLEISVEMTMIGGVAEYCVGDVCGSLVDTPELPPTPGTCFAQPAGLAHWWTGDDGADDQAGGANGTFVGGASFGPGIVGEALTFTGGAVAIDGQPNLGPGFTIEGWVLFNTEPAGYQTIFNNNQFFIRRNSGEEGGGLAAFVKLEDDSVEPRVQSTVAIEADTWHHFAATWDGVTLMLYLDGFVQQSQDRSGNMSPDTVQAQIGRGEQESIDAGPMSGLVDELTIFNRPLEPSEIAAIVAAGSNGKCR